jgi:hypothetical protein
MPDLQAGLAPFPRQHLGALLTLPPIRDLFPSAWDLCELALTAVDEGDVATFDRFITEIVRFPAKPLTDARRLAFWKVLQERRWQRAQRPFHYLAKVQRIVYRVDQRARQAEDDGWLTPWMLSLDEPSVSGQPFGSLLPQVCPSLNAFDAIYSVHLVNGLGQTACFDEEQGEPIPDCPNGLGNLIVGYNEPREEGEGVENIRIGSHNVVVGRFHNFSRFGGLVVGNRNTISSDWSVVSGGQDNTASANHAVVSGGQNRTAEEEFDWVAGGLCEDF